MGTDHFLLETVITSFPRRWGAPEKDDPDVLQSILRHLDTRDRDAITSAQDLVAVITSHCLEVFHRCRHKDDLQFLDFFESSIGKVVSRSLSGGWLCRDG